MMPTTKDDNYNDDDDRDNDHDYDDMSWKGQCDDDLTLVNVLGQYWNNHITIGVTIWLTGEPAWPGVGAPRVSSFYDQNEPVAKAMSSIMMTFTIIQVMMLMVVRLGRSSLLISIIILVMTHDDDDCEIGMILWGGGALLLIDFLPADQDRPSREGDILCVRTHNTYFVLCVHVTRITGTY